MANAGSFVKGQKRPNQGKRGPNKVTLELKDMIRQALDEAGGKDYLVQQAATNPNAFLSLVGRSMPKDIKAELAVKGWADVLIGLGRSSTDSQAVA